MLPPSVPFLAFLHEYRARPGVSPEILTNCAHCGAPIAQRGRGRHRRYCGDTCRRTACRLRSEAWTFVEENDPLLAGLPTLEDLYAAEHGDDVALKAWWADCEARGIVPPRSERQGVPVDDGRHATPSPEDSTVDHVSATIRAAQAVAAELRRHGLAAPGMVAVKCAAVASALDKALAESFGDVL